MNDKEVTLDETIGLLKQVYFGHSFDWREKKIANEIAKVLDRYEEMVRQGKKEVANDTYLAGYKAGFEAGKTIQQVLSNNVSDKQAILPQDIEEFLSMIVNETRVEHVYMADNHMAKIFLHAKHLLDRYRQQNKNVSSGLGTQANEVLVRCKGCNSAGETQSGLCMDCSKLQQSKVYDKPLICTERPIPAGKPYCGLEFRHLGKHSWE
jgi:hypothetical protein